MKKTAYICLGILMPLLAMIMGSCSDYEPQGLPEVPALEKVTDFKATINGHDVELSWVLPASEDVEGVRLILNGVSSNPVDLEGRQTTYTVKGQPIAEEHIYTAKVLYKGGYVSEGVTVSATLPEEDLADVTGLTVTTEGRTVQLSWTLPTAEGITGIRIVRNGDEAAATVLEGILTSAELKAQPMDVDLTYTVQVVYDGSYPSKGVSVSTKIPYIAPKMAFLLLAADADALPDDDERAAANWFKDQPDAEFVTVSQLADITADTYAVLWIMVDREGLEVGWKNLPAELVSDETIAALKAYSSNGGSLYLSNMATQLTAPLGIVPENMAPNIFASGAGGPGDDVWTINPLLGWKYRDGGEEGYYDRSTHEIYKGLTMEDPNGWGYNSLPLIGPGQREDHNCMWDCNVWGKGNQPDVIKNFEVTTGCLVLATWGHVVDHCVAGLVDFYANSSHGRCVANGFAAYEWSQNSAANIYQHNLEQLTSNILNYLK